VLPAALCALVATVGAPAVGADPASAEGSFGGPGEGAGQFVEPQGIAVDRESGDVYVLDSYNHRVEKYTREGAFLLAWGWGVADGATKAPQTCVTVCHAGLRGHGGGELGFAEGVAVDNDPLSPSHGDVYAVDIGNRRVEKFSPAGEFLLAFGGGVNETARETGETANENVCPVKPGDRCGAGVEGTADGQFAFHAEGDIVAVGPTGTVYVGDLNRVQELTPEGAYQGQVTLPPPEASGPEAGGVNALAVDAAGDLYVVRNGVGGVNEYDPAGRLLRTLAYDGEPQSTEGPTPTIALSSAGDLFVDDNANGHHVREFDPAGTELASFDAGMADAIHGIAFGDTIGELYLVNTNGNTNPPVALVRLATPPPPGPLATCGWCQQGWR
jgi:sugar lactone lactonase YvrE